VSVATRLGIALLLWLLGTPLAAAADVQSLPKSQATLLSYLYEVFPSQNSEDTEQPKIENPTPWFFRIWATNEAEECTYDNQAAVCKGFTLFLVISDGDLGGENFAFRTRKAYRWIVKDISVSKNAGGECALITMQERVPSKKAADGWGYRDSKTCVTPLGFKRMQRN